ncbi:hypothetical protein JCM8097_006220 [Rhodosporidiobolus ruineniae]
MSTKETLRTLARLFSPSPSASTSTSTPPGPFPGLSLPSDILSLLDDHIRTFASLPLQPPSGTTTTQTEGEKERARWRDGLLEIWQAVEPLPGTERDLHNIGRVSAFLVLLHKLSADVGDDEDSALVSRKDVGAVWWSTVLRRALLGTAKEEIGTTSLSEKERQTRGRKPTRKGKEPAGASSSGSTALQPLFLSRQALSAATKTVVWGMAPPRDQPDLPDDYVSPFGLVLLNEYEDRALARLKGLDEGYGIKNLEECLISWGEKSPKAFFVRIAPFINPNLPALLPSISLVLAYLSRHSTKAYHALSTPILSNLITVALTSHCSAIVTLVVRCLAIFTVTLPVIIGEKLFGILAAYGRVVCWESHEKDDDDSPSAIPSEDLHQFLEDYDDTPPDPVVLFTVLYGIYPCNFTAFLRDAVGYLREKKYQGPLGDGDIGLSSLAVRERSRLIMRQHTLNPALLSNDPVTELTAPERWGRLEAADVMAACDRNVVQLNPDPAHDWRGETMAGSAEGTGAPPSEVGDAGDLLKRSVLFEPSSVISPLHPHPLADSAVAAEDDDTPLDSTAPTPKPGSPPPTSPRDVSRAPSLAARAVSRARSPQTSASSAASPSPSRTSTPHMPATTHFANFQARQASSAGFHSPPSMSPLVRPRSASRFRSPVDVEGPPVHWPGVLGGIDPAHPPPPSSMSRRSSGVASSIGGLLSPELIPFSSTASASGTGASRHVSPSPGGLPPGATVSAAAANAQLVKLETELVLLQGEVNFQNYLKGLHLQHMGTLHREKVLESGAEAERQSSFRTIRTLRAQLRATQSSLDQLRSEQSATKANWTAHIADLREKLGGLREQRVRWEQEQKTLRAEVEDWKDRCKKKGRELEEGGRDFLDLKNQVAVDSVKLTKIGEYEHRIHALTKTLAICDADIVKFVDQRKEMNVLVGEWKKSELLRESVEEEGRKLKEALRSMETELSALRRASPSSPSGASPAPTASTSTSKDELTRLRLELERLRTRNWELEERLADRLEEEEEDEAVEEGEERRARNGDV